MSFKSLVINYGSERLRGMTDMRLQFRREEARAQKEPTQRFGPKGI